MNAHTRLDPAETAGDYASGMEFDETSFAPTDEDYRAARNPKTLVKRSRSYFESVLSDLSRQKAEAEQRIADAEADLAQITVAREAIDLALGRLNRA